MVNIIIYYSVIAHLKQDITEHVYENRIVAYT